MSFFSTESFVKVRPGANDGVLPAHAWKPCLRPSEEIRLLTLHPGSAGDAILFSIQTASLFEASDYQALSYTWGDPSMRVPVYLIDNTHAQSDLLVDEIKVTQNLKWALQDLRSTKSKMILWIDALCINQNDQKERTQQIQLMGLVYRQATSVLVWLGPDNNKIDSAVRLFRDAIRRKGSRGSGYGKNRDEAYKLKEEDWEAFTEFFSRSWWSRIWVVQELIYAKTALLICGKHQIPWKEVERATDTYKSNFIYPTTRPGRDRFESLCADFVQLEKHKRKYYEDPNEFLGLTIGETTPTDLVDHIPSPPLENLLWTFRYRQATDVRDKIYALVDLAKKPAPLQPDYSLSIREVYCQLAKTLTRKLNSAEILGITHNASSPRLKELPSWTPDWAAHKDTVSLGKVVSPLQGGIPFFHADDGITRSAVWEQCEPLRTFVKGRLAASADEDEPPHMLTIRGVLIGRTGSLGFDLEITHSEMEKAYLYELSPGIYIPQKSIFPLKRALQDWKSLISDHATYEPTGETSDDAFWATLSVKEPDTSRNTRKAEIRTKFAAWRTSLEKNDEALINEGEALFRLDVTKAPDELTAAKSNAAEAPYLPPLASLMAELKGWRFALTCENYYCLVPNLTKEGDIICVPFGSSTPFVLRPASECAILSPMSVPSSEHSRQYQLIGRCYVHGFMGGEAMEPLQSVLDQVQDIHQEQGMAAAKEAVDAEVYSFTLI